MLVNTPIFFALIAAVASTAIPSPLQETNSQRMARGLPPSPPKFGRNLPGNVQARQGTPVIGARGKPKPSPGPPVKQKGRIKVTADKNSTAIGFVRNTNSSSPIGGINFGADHDLHISFTTTRSGAGPFDIEAINAAFPPPLFLGAAATKQSDTLDLKSRNTLSFTNVEKTPPNSVPVKSPRLGVNVESAIWSFNPHTHEIMAQYINPDSSKPATVIAYDIRANSLFFVGDIEEYNKNNDTPASVVKFFLTEL